MAPGPQSHTPNSQWMTGPASTQAATMFAPQGHTMHQPPLQGHYAVPAPMQLGHTTPASHHGHLIQPHAPQQLQPPQPQPTAFTSPPASHFLAPATVLNPTPTHAYINHHRHNNCQHRRISHSPPPSHQQQPHHNRVPFLCRLHPQHRYLQHRNSNQLQHNSNHNSLQLKTFSPRTLPHNNLPKAPHPLLQQGAHLLPSQLIQTNVVRCRRHFAARAATGAAIADENNDSSSAHPSSDAAKDTQSIASPEHCHHVAPPATLQNNHVGSQENTEAADPNLEPSARTPDPGAVPHPLSCYAATQPSTDAHGVCHSGRNVKIDGITELIWGFRPLHLPPDDLTEFPPHLQHRTGDNGSHLPFTFRTKWGK